MIDEQKLIAWLEQRIRSAEEYNLAGDRRVAFRQLLSEISNGKFDAEVRYVTGHPRGPMLLMGPKQGNQEELDQVFRTSFIEKFGCTPEKYMENRAVDEFHTDEP